MSIRSDARLRLLEARIAEIERRLAEVALPQSETGAADLAPKTKRKSAPNSRQPNRKSR